MSNFTIAAMGLSAVPAAIAVPVVIGLKKLAEFVLLHKILIVQISSFPVRRDENTMVLSSAKSSDVASAGVTGGTAGFSIW